MDHEANWKVKWIRITLLEIKSSQNITKFKNDNNDKNKNKNNNKNNQIIMINKIRLIGKKIFEKNFCENFYALIW